MCRESVHWPGAFSLPRVVSWNKGRQLSEPLAGSLGSCCPGQGDKEAEQTYPDF